MTTVAVMEQHRVAGDLAATILARCDALAACTDEPGTILRSFLSPAMEQCARLVHGWMESAGMRVSQDAAGNMHGLYAGGGEDPPRLMIASHLDTVPNAGRYDGIAGVLLGIALVEALAGRRMPFSIEVVGFSDEEGVRYGVPFLGSRALTGTLEQKQLMLKDAQGASLGEALTAFAAAHPQARPAGLHRATRAYLEFHIEQGPVLDAAGVPLAVVAAIAGQTRGTMAFEGLAGHAGTTPMSLRQDALTAAAEWLLTVEAIALATPGLVATTGRVVCEPGAANVIPARVQMSLDIRSDDDLARQKAMLAISASAQAVAGRRKAKCVWTVDAEQPAVQLDPALTQLCERALRSVDVQPLRMTSGAGHDAMVMAPFVPAAMIFLRSPGGISHHPGEAVRAEDLASALLAGMQFLKEFPGWLESEAHICRT